MRLEACERTPGKKGVRGRAGEALEARTRVSPGDRAALPSDDDLRGLAGGAARRSTRPEIEKRATGRQG